MKKLMYQLKKILTRENIPHFEIDHIRDEPYYIDIRLIHETKETADRIAECIKNANTGDKILEIETYVPDESTINYGFSGISFTGISLEINLSEAISLDEDFILLDDNEPVI